MDIIENNPFRIAGILSNVSLRELQKQKAKISAYSKVGKEIKSDFDFQFLKNISRSEESVNKAFSNIEQNQDRVNFGLFWFLNANPFDDTSIEYLKSGDETKAVEIWKKVTVNKDVNSKNFSAFNNLGTYKLLGQSQNDLKEGIEAKIKLLESEYFESFVHSVADETFTINSEKQIEKFIDELLVQFKNRFSKTEILQLFKNCNGASSKYLSQKLIEDPIHKIENLTENVKRRRKGNKDVANKLGSNLYMDSRDDLIFLRSVLGTNHLKYKILADNLTNEIMQCGIDYFENWKETKDPSGDSLRLLEYARLIAVGIQAKDRVKSNIHEIKEWVKLAPIKGDLDALTGKISRFQNITATVANARELVNYSKPKLISIKKTLGSQDKIYLNFSSAIVNNSLGMLVATVNRAQENIPMNIYGGGRDISKLSSIIENALDVSYSLQKLDMNPDLRQHFVQNHTALKGLARQLDVSTLSPEEKLKAKIENHEKKLIGIRSKQFKGKDLERAKKELNDLKLWRLFRSKETKDREIKDLNKLIQDIKEKGEAEKKNEISKLEAEIQNLNRELKELNY